MACLWLVFLLYWSSSFALHASNLPSAGASESSPLDPNRGPSEFNHHVAGYALIGAGVIVLIAMNSSRFRAMRFIWPFLFLSAGVFLAVWSDAEMWPRGNLNWLWLLHHDREAGQHKIYALLLIAVGFVEYFRLRGGLSRFWRIWSFPLLAVIGAGLLLVHDHGQGGGGHTPEARAYLVNPALDCDGKPWPAASPDSLSRNAETHSGMAQEGMLMAQDMKQQPMNHEHMDHEHMNHDSLHAASGATESSGPTAPESTLRTDSSTGSPQSITPIADPPMPSMAHGSEHHHLMTPGMLMVKREHFWFMIVGFAIALFKFISDADLGPRRLVRSATYLWPSAIVVLGVLLTLYRE